MFAFIAICLLLMSPAWLQIDAGDTCEKEGLFKIDERKFKVCWIDDNGNFVLQYGECDEDLVFSAELSTCHYEPKVSVRSQSKKNVCYNKGNFCSDCKTLSYCWDRGNGGYEVVSTVKCKEFETCSAYENKCVEEKIPQCEQSYRPSCNYMGLFPDPYLCNEYYFCDGPGATPLNMTCPHGHYYDPLYKECIHFKKDVKPPCPPTKLCTEAYSMVALEKNPNIYYLCVPLDDSPRTFDIKMFRCPFNEIFDGHSCTKNLNERGLNTQKVIPGNIDGSFEAGLESNEDSNNGDPASFAEDNIASRSEVSVTTSNVQRFKRHNIDTASDGTQSGESQSRNSNANGPVQFIAQTMYLNICNKPNALQSPTSSSHNANQPPSMVTNDNEGGGPSNWPPKISPNPPQNTHLFPIASGHLPPSDSTSKTNTPMSEGPPYLNPVDKLKNPLRPTFNNKQTPLSLPLRPETYEKPLRPTFNNEQTPSSPPLRPQTYEKPLRPTFNNEQTPLSPPPRPQTYEKPPHPPALDAKKEHPVPPKQSVSIHPSSTDHSSHSSKPMKILNPQPSFLWDGAFSSILNGLLGGRSLTSNNQKLASEDISASEVITKDGDNDQHLATLRAGTDFHQESKDPTWMPSPP